MAVPLILLNEFDQKYKGAAHQSGSSLQFQFMHMKRFFMNLGILHFGKECQKQYLLFPFLGFFLDAIASPNTYPSQSVGE